MKDVVKKGILLGLGAASIAKKQAENAVKELARKKTISRKDANKILGKIKKTAYSESKRVARFAEQEANRMAMEFGIVSKNKARKTKKMLMAMDRHLTKEGKKALKKIIKELE